MSTVDFGAAIRTALKGEAAIYGVLSEWQGEPAIFTRRPVPGDTIYPFILVSPNKAVSDTDGLTSRRITVMKDILIYGSQPDQYRLIETVADLVRTLFHRNRFSISVDGYHIIQIVANGPSVAPSDDEKQVARVVTLTISAQRV